MATDANQSLTPVMQQYKKLKATCSNPKELLFFRLGDFYEMFFDDAVIASREIGLTLTRREKHIPMCGVPYRTVDTYITKLIAKGYKVSVAEQTSDPKAAGLTEREIVRVVTPGTILAEDALQSSQNNYLALILENDGKIFLAGADISTGECFFGIYENKNIQQNLQNLFNEFYKLNMAELVIVGRISFQKELYNFLEIQMPSCMKTIMAEPISLPEAENFLRQHFQNRECIPQNSFAKVAIGSLLDYLHETVRTNLSYLNRLQFLDVNDFLILDTYTLRNLEITKNLRDGTRANTLLELLDFTQTAMGSRLLKKILEQPLLSTVKIEQRLDAVEELAKKFSVREQLQDECKKIYDFERLLMRLENNAANPRDLLALKNSFQALPLLKNILKETDSFLLTQCQLKMQTFDNLAELLEKAILDEPSLTLKEGNIIKPGYNAELDEYRSMKTNSQTFLQEMEERERRETGIKFLKISYNKVFGYFIEVRNSGKDLVPSHYIRKQTLANSERFITPELKDFETKILGATEKIIQIEFHLFLEIREILMSYLEDIQETAKQIAKLDVFSSLAEAACRYNYVRPKLQNRDEIFIQDGRHPLVEHVMKDNLFVPNDTKLNHHDCEMMLITGPNMAGKSTYMRQVALLTVMAQMGSFVPAREASICPVDRIFSRIGASDDLVSGQSTFMVEMNEVSQILKNATQNSLIILDEIGRGTSTFDGMSIAHAVIDYIVQKIHAKTLVATHYHELAVLASEYPVIKNFSIAVKERQREVIFLRRIIEGAAMHSYGIYVAKLAGLPNKVIERAEEILKQLEEDKAMHTAPIQNAAPKKEDNSLFQNMLYDDIIQKIKTVDIPSLTPLEAMTLLFEMQRDVKKLS